MTADPYAALLALAEREHGLVDSGRVDELAALAAERDALIARLPATPPASALPALERAAGLHMATQAALKAALAVLGRELAELRTGRDLVRAYAPAAGYGAAPSVDRAA